ncbi:MULTISPECIES: hypothetical protein [Herbaspirillum]|uniref:Uncharacterized protein n=2 Tax=Herbaspirillum huttiense TaxID=863372 RepID=A0AAJ2H563_9BURK|nr:MULTISPECIES: hypothetical protein [Herbaspirillum]MDR9836947.1 hypothetical protein [Herbaspirillum huttiense]
MTVNSKTFRAPAGGGGFGRPQMDEALQELNDWVASSAVRIINVETIHSGENRTEVGLKLWYEVKAQ